MCCCCDQQIRPPPPRRHHFSSSARSWSWWRRPGAVAGAVSVCPSWLGLSPRSKFVYTQIPLCKMGCRTSRVPNTARNPVPRSAATGKEKKRTVRHTHRVYFIGGASENSNEPPPETRRNKWRHRFRLDKSPSARDCFGVFGRRTGGKGGRVFLFSVDFGRYLHKSLRFWGRRCKMAFSCRHNKHKCVFRTRFFQISVARVESGIVSLRKWNEAILWSTETNRTKPNLNGIVRVVAKFNVFARAL